MRVGGEVRNFQLLNKWATGIDPLESTHCSQYYKTINHYYLKTTVETDKTLAKMLHLLQYCYSNIRIGNPQNVTPSILKQYGTEVFH
jgi:hypothetical protein